MIFKNEDGTKFWSSFNEKDGRKFPTIREGLKKEWFIFGLVGVS